MMGFQSDTQQKLFYTCLNLEKRIRKDHILRDIAKHIDFDFAYKQVEDKYGSKGNVSVPPPIILKMMLLLIFYNVRFERELTQTILNVNRLMASEFSSIVCMFIKGFEQQPVKV